MEELLRECLLLVYGLERLDDDEGEAVDCMDSSVDELDEDLLSSEPPKPKKSFSCEKSNKCGDKEGEDWLLF